ncbi:Uma2 family endonuclease [Planktothrix agardhii]|uniref:Uma2 family endonuclease n=1 Tax=Planktothrix agardhii TaxID=1160 RepID=UPI001D0A77EA|nr:Uma2 family endonuclease [Planktothrix agardhii]MCB8753147.1 Uma2 family endonuclease [Planktothrix agardhii 1810]
MVQTPSKIITVAEFLKQPETKPASEYIEGKIIQKSMPQGKHSTIQGELVTAINAILKPAKIARAFPELRCTFEERSIVPDVSVFTWDRIPRDHNSAIANSFLIAPDWMIEILSPDQSPTKVIKKILYCLNYQTQMAWLIDPEEPSIFVYHSQQQTEVFDQPESPISVPPFATDIKLTVGELFGWLLE